MEPVLPRLAAAQRAGQVGIEQVQTVVRAMQKLTRPDLNPDQVAAAEQLLVKHAQQLGLKDLRLVADRRTGRPAQNHSGRPKMSNLDVPLSHQQIRWQLPTAGRLAAPFDRPRISRAPDSHHVKDAD